ncbi:DgyrCDS8211 [Dimorphilus gyrociliatus]|uniref:DgyrCDS8211 n=1 Tax=Dimorphilus gyrociliatus TaxID=2664684 RepID=A0A7I8VVQ6_9ANNE|nr:DgyrCDS8211 [Dimorphilus gyrociliatus]
MADSKKKPTVIEQEFIQHRIRDFLHKPDDSKERTNKKVTHGEKPTNLNKPDDVSVNNEEQGAKNGNTMNELIAKKEDTANEDNSHNLQGQELDSSLAKQDFNPSQKKTNRVYEKRPKTKKPTYGKEKTCRFYNKSYVRHDSKIKANNPERHGTSYVSVGFPDYTEQNSFGSNYEFFNTRKYYKSSDSLEPQESNIKYRHFPKTNDKRKSNFKKKYSFKDGIDTNCQKSRQNRFGKFETIEDNNRDEGSNEIEKPIILHEENSSWSNYFIDTGEDWNAECDHGVRENSDCHLLNISEQPFESDKNENVSIRHLCSSNDEEEKSLSTQSIDADISDENPELENTDDCEKLGDNFEITSPVKLETESEVTVSEKPEVLKNEETEKSAMATFPSNCQNSENKEGTKDELPTENLKIPLIDNEKVAPLEISAQQEERKNSSVEETLLEESENKSESVSNENEIKEELQDLTAANNNIDENTEAQYVPYVPDGKENDLATPENDSRDDVTEFVDSESEKFDDKSYEISDNTSRYPVRYNLMQFVYFTSISYSSLRVNEEFQVCKSYFTQDHHYRNVQRPWFYNSASRVSHFPNSYHSGYIPKFIEGSIQRYNSYLWPRKEGKHFSSNWSLTISASDSECSVPLNYSHIEVKKKPAFKRGFSSSISNRYRQKFEDLKTPYFDSHCHIDYILNNLKFKHSSFQSVMMQYEDLFPLGYKGCVTNFCDPIQFKCTENSLWNEVLKIENVYGTVGCHPKKVKFLTEAHETAMEEMLKHPKCVALGEIGLDFSKDFFREKEKQVFVLKRQVALAIKHNKPIVIHARDANDEIIEELLSLNLGNHKIHRHCFVGSRKEMDDWLKHFPNSFIGFTPLLTFADHARAQGIRECARHMPLNKLLLETDAPYFIPREVKGATMNQVSLPPFCISVAEEVAALREEPLETILEHVRKNTADMYGVVY